MKKLNYLLSAVKTASDCSLWLILTGTALLFLSDTSNLLPFIFSSGLGTVIFLLIKDKSKALGYIGLIFALTPVIFCKSIFSVFVILVFTVYLFYCFNKESLTPVYIQIEDYFPKAAVISILLGFYNAWKGNYWVFAVCLLFLLFTVYLMRVLRHSEESLNDKLIISELILLVVFTAFIIFCSSKTFLSLLITGGGFIYSQIIIPILSVFALIVYGVLWVFVKILGLFFHVKEDRQMPPLMSKTYGLTEDILNQVEVNNGNRAFILIILRVLGIIFAAIIIFLFLRWLFTSMSKSSETAEEIDISEKTDTIIYKTEKALSPLDRSPEARIRKTYRSYLEALKNAGAPFSHSDTSKDILELNESIFHTDESLELRNIYIKARYSAPGKVNSSDAKKASQLAKKLKSQIKKKQL